MRVFSILEAKIIMFICLLVYIALTNWNLSPLLWSCLHCLLLFVCGVFISIVLSDRHESDSVGFSFPNSNKNLIYRTNLFLLSSSFPLVIYWWYWWWRWQQGYKKSTVFFVSSWSKMQCLLNFYEKIISTNISFWSPDI